MEHVTDVLRLASLGCRDGNIPDSLSQMLASIRKSQMGEVGGVTDRFILQRLHSFTRTQSLPGLHPAVAAWLVRWVAKMHIKPDFMLECEKELREFAGAGTCRSFVTTWTGTVVDVGLILSREGFPQPWRDIKMAAHQVSKTTAKTLKSIPVAFVAAPAEFVDRFTHKPLGMLVMAKVALEMNGWRVVLVRENDWRVSAEERKEFLKRCLDRVTHEEKDRIGERRADKKKTEVDSPAVEVST